MPDLRSLKAGDEVAITGRCPVRVVRIERVTATQIITGHYRWSRVTGAEIPFDSVSRRRIEPAAAHHREWVEREAMEREIVYALDGYRLRETIEKLTTEKLRMIADALKGAV